MSTVTDHPASLPRLADATLGRAAAGVVRPPYDRTALRPGIVHLGVGAFHRAHQAVYTDLALGHRFGPWGIVGVSLRHPDVRDALAPQDHLYAVAERSAEAEVVRVVGCLQDMLVAPEDPARVVAVMAAPETRIVSLTVTEKGYCHSPATGTLDPAHPDIVHDLANPARPRSAPGFLVEALARRRAAGHGPFTILCCDNLPDNGPTVRKVILALAEARDPALARWIADHAAFPATMVDRIVPRLTEAERAAVSARLGLDDRQPVVCENFRQWVIEDSFCAGRPAWEAAGAQLVHDVASHERMKLRMLNGAHSALAYLGALAGYDTIIQAMGDPAYARFARGLMLEAASTFAAPEGADPTAYADTLLSRFANPVLQHRTWQIAMDGSQKLPQRLLGTARDRLAAGQALPHVALAIAGWMRFVTGVGETGQPHTVDDPLAARLAGATRGLQGDARKLFEALIGFEAIFGADLKTNQGFRAQIIDALDGLIRRGARGCVASFG